MSRFAFRRTAVLLVAVVTALSLWLAGTASAQGPDGRVNGQPWVNSWGGVAVYCNASNSGFAPGLNIGVGGVVVLNDAGQLVLYATRDQINACTNRLNNNLANNNGTSANNASGTGNFNNGGAGGTAGTNNFNNGGMNGAGGTTGTGNFNNSGAGGNNQGSQGNFNNAAGAGGNNGSGFNNMIISNGACIVSGVSANRLGIGSTGNTNGGNNGGANANNAGGTGGSNQGNFTQGSTGAGGNNGGANANNAGGAGNNNNGTNANNAGGAGGNNQGNFTQGSTGAGGNNQGGRSVGQGGQNNVGGFSSIYNLLIFPDGSMQLNSRPDAEGKTFLGTWSGCK